MSGHSDLSTGSTDFLTLEDLGKRLQLSPKTLRRLVRDDGLPAWRIVPHGPLCAFWPEIEGWIKQRRVAMPASGKRRHAL